MLQAELEDGRLVLLAAYRIEQIHELRKCRFFCPACKKAVIIRAGRKVIPHFAHEQIQDCELTRTGESLYHMRGKLQLFRWLKRQGYTVKVEERIGKSERRPDLLLHTPGGRLLAIEYQCASLSDEELYRRNEAYGCNGILPIWILGGNRMKRTSTYMLDLSKRDQRFLMQYKRDMPLQLLYYCSDSEAFCNVQHILLTGKKRTVGQFYFRPLQQIHFPQLFQALPKNVRQIDQAWTDFQAKMAARPLTYASAHLKRWVLQLYERGVSLQSMPLHLLHPVESQYHMSVPPYVWQTDLWLKQLDPLPIMKSVTLEQLKYVSRRWEALNKPFAIFADLHPVESYMDRLCQHGWFERLGTDAYVKKRHSPFSGMT